MRHKGQNVSQLRSKLFEPNSSVDAKSRTVVPAYKATTTINN